MRVEEAQSLVLARVRAGAATRVPLGAAFGTIAAAPVDSPIALPAAAVAVMDGYAVRDRDLVGDVARVPVIGESAAGRPFAAALAGAAAVRISTGAIVPTGADRVVAQEDTTRDGELVAIDVPRALGSARFVRAAGSDVARGSRLVEPGSRLGATELALLTACGQGEIDVHARPRVVVVSTGDELVAPGTAPGPGQIVGTNGGMLAALARAAGAEVLPQIVAADDLDVLVAALADALEGALAADVVITCGGASVGDHDLVLPALQRCGARVHFHGVAARPGKPTAYATTATSHVFALPGNPASAFVMFELFVRPALRRLLGVRGEVVRPLRRLPAATALAGAGARAHYLRARIVDGRVHALPDQASGSLRSLVDVDALVRVPIGVDRVDAGSECDALVLSDAWYERA
ncbi:MAG TPA: gephyrin-like molybdotransferase Glp [Nannocystaceae bacterium]|nr:gephyrin-like molybdotransferase Glp [Nannocystaceae bacterium]